jgi:hypothetical protein
VRLHVVRSTIWNGIQRGRLRNLLGNDPSEPRSTAVTGQVLHTRRRLEGRIRPSAASPLSWTDVPRCQHTNWQTYCNHLLHFGITGNPHSGWCSDLACSIAHIVRVVTLVTYGLP